MRYKDESPTLPKLFALHADAERATECAEAAGESVSLAYRLPVSLEHGPMEDAMLGALSDPAMQRIMITLGGEISKVKPLKQR